MTTERKTLERLRLHLYDGKEPDPKPRPTSGGVKVKLNDLADFLAAHPGAKVPKGKPMFCAKCGRPFQGGEFRVFYQAGQFCRHCYELLALAPVGARCVYCKEVIAIDCWRYELYNVMAGGGDLKRFFAHQDCKGKIARLDKAA